MKIALVLFSPPGYSETFFNSQIQGLKEKGHEVILFTAYNKNKYGLCKHIMHPKVHRFYIIQIFLMVYRSLTLLPYFKTVSCFFRLEKNEGTSIKRIIEKIYLNASLLAFKGDWIHFGFATTALGRELVPKSIKAKMAVSFRGYDVNVYPLKHAHCYGLLWQRVDKIHSISRYLLLKAYDLGLDADKPFQVIHPAVNLENLPKLYSSNNKTSLKIVTIARFNWIKGLDLLAEVALILKNKEIDFQWTIIGTGNAAEKEKYKFDVQEKQLQDHLKNKGQCTHAETLNILNTCDVYVQTSLKEGFCNALLEAQALGIPCVAFKVGGIPENIEEDKTGWLIEPYDVVAMAKKIIDASDLLINEKNKLAKYAIDRVKNKFNLEQQKCEFHKFYTE